MRWPQLSTSNCWVYSSPRRRPATVLDVRATTLRIGLEYFSINHRGRKEVAAAAAAVELCRIVRAGLLSAP